MAVLGVSSLTKTYGGVVAIDDISFEIGERNVLGLIGPNGAGKTTLFNLITGFESPDTGEITFDGDDITSKQPHERAEMGLVRTFQEPQLFSRLTTLENLLVAGEPSKNETAIAAFFDRFRSVGEEELIDRAVEVLDDLDLYEVRNEYAGDLSGGQEKLLELGKVLMLEPSFVMLDEPSAGVHPDLTDNIATKIEDIAENEDIQFFIIEHNVPFVSRLSDEILVLSNGQIIARKPPDELQHEEAVVEAYLGESISGQ